MQTNDPIPLADRVRDALRDNPRAMTVQLARALNVPEADVVAALPAGSVVELDATRWEELIRAFEPLGDVHVIATNGAVTFECFGRFGNFSHFAGYFNVQTKTIDMHVRGDQLARAFAVEKPGHLDGVNTLSVQFFDRRGDSAFKVFLSFGGTRPPAERVAQFEALRDRFRVA